MGVTEAMLLQIGGDARGASRALKQIEREATSSARRIASSTAQGLRGVATSLGVAATALGTFTALLGGASVAAAAEFQFEMAKVASLLDSEGMKSFAGMEQQMRDLGAELGSTADKTGALYQTISASVDPSKAAGVVATALKAATAGLSDGDSAAKLLTSTMNAFNKTADDVDNISDVFFKTIARGQTTFEELVPTFGNVSSLAAGLGVEFTDVAAAVSTLTRAGLKTDKAVIGIRQVLSSIDKMKPGSMGDKMAKAFNVDFSLSALKSKGLAAFLDDIKKKTAGSTQALGAFFGDIRARNAVTALMNNIEGLTIDVGLMAEAYSDAADETGDAFDKIMATTTGQTRLFKQSLLDVARDVGTVFLPEIQRSLESINAKFPEFKKNAIGFAHDVLAFYKSVSPEIKSFVTSILPTGDQLLGFMRSVGAGVRTAGMTIKAVFTTINSLRTAYTGGGLSGVLEEIGTSMPAVHGAATALVKFGSDASVSMNNAKQAAGVWLDFLDRRFGQLVAWLSPGGGTSASVVDAFGSLHTAVSGGLLSLAEGTVSALDSIIDKFATFASGIVTSVTASFNEGGVKQVLHDGLVALFGETVALGATVGVDLGSALVQGIVSRLGEAVGAIGAKMKSVLSEAWEQARQYLPGTEPGSFLGNAVEGAKNLAGRASTTLGMMNTGAGLAKNALGVFGSGPGGDIAPADLAGQAYQALLSTLSSGGAGAGSHATSSTTVSGGGLLNVHKGETLLTSAKTKALESAGMLGPSAPSGAESSVLPGDAGLGKGGRFDKLQALVYAKLRPATEKAVADGGTAGMDIATADTIAKRVLTGRNPAGLQGAIFEAGLTGGVDGLFDALASGDVKGAISGFADGLKDAAMQALIDAVKQSLPKKLLGAFGIPGFASGGVTPGGPVWVGEEGPELANLPRGTRVFSNEESRQMVANGGGGGGLVIHGDLILQAPADFDFSERNIRKLVKQVSLMVDRRKVDLRASSAQAVRSRV